MIGFFKSLFSNDKIIDSGIKGIDKLFYTDEEKADYKQKLVETHISMLGAYEPHRRTQRFITLLFCGLFAFAFLLFVGLITFHYELEASNILDAVRDFYIGEIVLTIIAFYFGGDAVAKVRQARKIGTKDN
jgi:hypothetical protein